MIDFASLEKPSKPNSHLVAPEGLCQRATPDAPAPVFRQEPEALFLNLKARLENDPQYKDVSADPRARAISALAVTKLLRFKDDLDIAVLPTEEGSTLAIYSRSRIGYSDMGANRKRVDALIAALRKETQLAEGRVA